MIDLLIDSAIGPEVGMGHLMRCKVLAETARQQFGWTVAFLARTDETKKAIFFQGEETATDNIESRHKIIDYPHGFWADDYLIDIYNHSPYVTGRVLRGYAYAIVGKPFIEQRRTAYDSDAPIKIALNPVTKLSKDLQTSILSLTFSVSKKIKIETVGCGLMPTGFAFELTNASAIITKIGQICLESMAVGRPTIIIDQRMDEEDWQNKLMGDLEQFIKMTNEEKTMLAKKNAKMVDGHGARRIIEAMNWR